MLQVRKLSLRGVEWCLVSRVCTSYVTGMAPSRGRPFCRLGPPGQPATFVLLPVSGAGPLQREGLETGSCGPERRGGLEDTMAREPPRPRARGARAGAYGTQSCELATDREPWAETPSCRWLLLPFWSKGRQLLNSSSVPLDPIRTFLASVIGTTNNLPLTPQVIRGRAETETESSRVRGDSSRISTPKLPSPTEVKILQRERRLAGVTVDLAR